MKNVPVLSGLLGWFAGRDENRRRYPRVKKSFRAALTLDGTTWQPAIGVDMSGGGMCILTQQELASQTSFQLRMTLETRLINMRVRPVWNTRVNHNGKPVHCHGVQFTSVGVEDWDTIMHWVTGKAVGVDEPEAQQPAAAVMGPDDVDRLLPAAFQARLLNELVKRKRLAPLAPNAPPLVQFEYGGVTHLRGKAMHKLTIESKIGSGKNEHRYSTRFMFDDTGKDLVILN